MNHAENFYEYALEIFRQSGHTDAVEPEFFNHSAKQFVYFDCDKKISLTMRQRDLLKKCDNVSRLFTVDEIAFFATNLLTLRSTKSQAAHDIHTLIQSIVDKNATVCIFRHFGEIIFSFAGYDEKILNLLNISNLTVTNAKEYFYDLVNIFARSYYFSKNRPTNYDLLPIIFFSDSHEKIFREEIDKFINEQKLFYVKYYGNDYVEYDTTAAEDLSDNSAEFDLILSEAEEIQIEVSEESEAAQSELADIDDEIFDDPVLLMEYLEKNVQVDEN